MDELNDIKQAWQAFSNVSNKKQYSTEELHNIVRKKSNNELQKIQRKLLLEWGVAIFISALMVVMVGINKPSDILYALIFVGVILSVSFIPYYKIVVFKYHQNQDLKSHLSGFINAFERLVNQYIRMSTILVPFAGLGGFLLGFHSTAGQDVWQVFFSLKFITILVGAVLAISFGGNWFQRRYFTWVYGKNIERLKNSLADLSD